MLFDLEAMPLPMVFAVYRIIKDCNEEFAALFGYLRGELIDTSFSRLYPAVADFIRTGFVWQHNFMPGLTYYDERIMENAAGECFWCQVHGRSKNREDPFSAALYAFQAMARPVSDVNFILSPRQRQILALVAQGKTSAVIAAELGLSKRSVETHRLRISRIVGARNSAELVAWFSSCIDRVAVRAGNSME